MSLQEPCCDLIVHDCAKLPGQFGQHSRLVAKGSLSNMRTVIGDGNLSKSCVCVMSKAVGGDAGTRVCCILSLHDRAKPQGNLVSTVLQCMSTCSVAVHGNLSK